MITEETLSLIEPYPDAPDHAVMQAHCGVMREVVAEIRRLQRVEEKAREMVGTLDRLIGVQWGTWSEMRRAMNVSGPPMHDARDALAAVLETK